MAMCKMSLNCYSSRHIDIWKSSACKHNPEKKNRIVMHFLHTFYPSSTILWHRFRRQILWTYVQATSGRTSIHHQDVRPYTLWRTCIEKTSEKMGIYCPIFVIWRLMRIAYLPWTESLADFIALIEAFRKADSKLMRLFCIIMSVGINCRLRGRQHR